MPEDDQKVSLRDHFAEQIRWIDRYFEKRFENVQTAVDKAESQLNSRLVGMNEFRETLKDQASKLATKDETNLLMSALDKRIQILERNQSSGQGRASIAAVLWAAGVSLGILLLSKFILKW